MFITWENNNSCKGKGIDQQKVLFESVSQLLKEKAGKVPKTVRKKKFHAHRKKNPIKIAELVGDSGLFSIQ